MRFHAANAEPRGRSDSSLLESVRTDLSSTSTLREIEVELPV
jgi:hypothetical protein